MNVSSSVFINSVVGKGLAPFRNMANRTAQGRAIQRFILPTRRSGCAVQPDIGNENYLRAFFANIYDARFNPIRFAQGQAEEPDLRLNVLLMSCHALLPVSWHHTLDPFHNSGKTSIVGKGLAPFRNMANRNSARPISYEADLRHKRS